MLRVNGFGQIFAQGDENEHCDHDNGDDEPKKDVCTHRYGYVLSMFQRSPCKLTIYKR